MATSFDVSINAVSINPIPKPHTIYHVQLRLPLRSYTVLKRYSEFRKLYEDMEQEIGEAPPFRLPPKQFFSRSTNNAELTEHRRLELEQFLQDINASPDARWRLSNPWKKFLNLSPLAGNPGGEGKRNDNILPSSSNKNYPSRSMLSGKTISNPVLWLNTLHEVKADLHQARKYISDRDTLTSSSSVSAKTGILESRSASAEAKKCLVQCATKVVILQRGLKDIAEYVGQGELRRRTDMLNIVKKERDGLESLLTTISQKGPSLPGDDLEDQDRSALLGASDRGILGSVASSAKRVLGPLRETSETRPLDNRGLMQLQMQRMQDQEDSLLEFSKILGRQKQIGIEINEELEIQNEMLRMLDEDVERSDAKIGRADRRLRKIK